MSIRLAGLMFAALAFLVNGAATGFTLEKKGDGIPDVKGTVFRVDGNKNKDSKITAEVKDTIVLEYTYPISPPFPKSAKQSSSDGDVVKGTGVHRVVQVKGPIGTGRFAAVFVAEKKGKATLTFEVMRGEETVKISCDVEVK